MTVFLAAGMVIQRCIKGVEDNSRQRGQGETGDCMHALYTRMEPSEGNRVTSKTEQNIARPPQASRQVNRHAKGRR